MKIDFGLFSLSMSNKLYYYIMTDKISVSFNYPTETITAENSEGVLDILIPESIILYNNKVFIPNDYVSSNMYILSQVIEKKMVEDKINHKNYNDLIIQLRRITMGLYNIPNNVIIIKKNIL